MATSYKTPGVYVEEISKFPPSVAEVETAIPAFVGYTEKAKKISENDLLNLPTRIKSLLEYELYFGKGPEYEGFHVAIDANKVVDESGTTVSNSKYCLYDSMRLFYDNGGGVCYICAVGLYSNAHNDDTRGDNIKTGVEAIAKFDEPTLLLFPDACNLTSGSAVNWNKLASIQQAALKQAGDLGDRFALLDVPDTSANNTETDADNFRTKVGMNNLKYGAAYYPFVKTVYDKKFRLRDINKNTTVSGAPSNGIKFLFTDSDKNASGEIIKTKISNFEAVYTDVDFIGKRLAAFAGSAQAYNASDLDLKFKVPQNAFAAASTDANRISAIKDAFTFLFNAYSEFEKMLNGYAAPIPPSAQLKVLNADMINVVKGVMTTNLKSSVQTFSNLNDEAFIGAKDIHGTAIAAIDFSAFLADWKPAAPPGANDYIPNAGTITEKGTSVFASLQTIYNSIRAGFDILLNSASSYEAALEDGLIADIPVYRSIVNALNKKVNTLPPSGAIAGIYASVDRDRGVWKAPANVSINSVSDVSILIDNATQEGLNIDATAGKSVNAIRPFFGKGILVWGSRTLAGNDNEWRYVPVRRLFNFVEESCKKSTSWCVFEPNDANTWARIRGQIDGFLNNIWRRGALAGAKPEHAYYVNCGLGITMTAQDILEGRLIVEIGMAAVRPAEFVILKFSHKLQQS